MHLGDAAAELGAVLHLGQLVDQEHELAVAGTGDEAELGIAVVLDDEARVADVALAAHALQVGLPTLAVGRIGEHEVELAGGEGVLREGRAEVEVLGLLALAFEQEVGLGDGVGFGIHFLAEKMDRDFLAVLGSQLRQAIFGHGQHAAGAAGAVVDEVGAGFDLVGDGQEDQVGHELHHVAGGEVLARLLVVLFVEAADQFLEDRAHGVVVERGETLGAVRVQHRLRAEVDRVVEELLDQAAEDVGLDQGGNLVAELELVEDFLDVGRKAVEVAPRSRP